MSIGAEQAIEAARECSTQRDSLRWSDKSVSVQPGVVSGRDCWIVSTDGSPNLESGEPPWFEVFTDTRLSYLIDMESGSCIGVRVGQYNHYLPPAAPGSS